MRPWRAGEVLGPSARCSDDRQGVLRHAGYADDLGAFPSFATTSVKADGGRCQPVSRPPARTSSARPTFPSTWRTSQTYNPLYGTTGNPWDTGLTSGGSSGGSAAALAAGLSALEAGSDIGGSIRNPAHFCGVYGHKPTWGVVPKAGHELLQHTPDGDLSVCGPLARSAEDLAVALVAMAGPTGRERRGWHLELPPPEFSRLGDLRVVLWPNDDLSPVSAEIADQVVMVGETLARLGAKVSDTARPPFDIKLAHDTYISLLNAAMSARQPEDEYMRDVARAAGFDPADTSFRAVSARGTALSHREWLSYDFKREHLRFAWDEFFDEWDILLCPQMATTAFPHDHRPFGQRTIDVDGMQRDYFEQLFWSGLVTNAYLPSTVFPTGLSRRRPADRDSGGQRGLSRPSHHRVRPLDCRRTGRIPSADTAGPSISRLTSLWTGIAPPSPGLRPSFPEQAQRYRVEPLTKAHAGFPVIQDGTSRKPIARRLRQLSQTAKVRLLYPSPRS